jgi:hypothetical protein
MSLGVPPLDHLLVLSDDVGVIQHATENIPNRSTGYCTDDVARALIVALQRLELFPDDAAATSLVSTYLAFLYDAQLPDGRFHNFMDYQRSWIDEVGTHDSCGRAMWGLGYAVRFAPDPGWHRISTHMLERALLSAPWLEYPRAQAYAILGLVHAARADASANVRLTLHQLAESLLERYRSARDDGWEWFEPFMTYDNARLCEALIRAGMALEDSAMREAGLRTLGFLEQVVFEGTVFVPIGNAGWYERGGVRARFGQQPLEAAAMTDAELAAFAATGGVAHLHAAEHAAAWYRGNNLLDVSMAAHGGGCYDGLEEGGPSRNVGAESTLAYLATAYALAITRKLGKTAPEGESIRDDNSGVRST